MDSLTRAAPGNSASGETTRGRGPAIVIAALVGIYMLSQFFRNSIAVIAPDLARAFDLDAAALGFLSSVFFLAFSAAQIPLGVAIDRWGPKAPMVATALLLIAATLFFALAADSRQLTAARLLLGLGCCAFFMAPLALYAGLFSAERFSTVASIHLGGGSLGMLMATAPLAIGAATIGWRAVFLIAAGFAALMTVTLVLFVHEAPQAAAARRSRAESWGETFAGIVGSTRVPGFWRLFFMQAASSSTLATILGLWVGPWLADVYRAPIDQRGNLVLALAVAQIAAVFAWGPTDRLFRSYRIPVLIGSGLVVAALALAAVVAIPRAAVPWALGFYGAALGFFPVLVAHGKSLFPPALTGRGITLLNMGTMGGTFVMQSVTGLAIETFGFRLVDGARIYPPEAYRLVFAILAAQLALAAWFYRRAPDREDALAAHLPADETELQQ